MNLKIIHSNSKLYSPAWKKISRIFGIPLPLDRTEKINFGFDYKILSPIPSDPYTNKSFAELCDVRAQELNQKASKPILIMWSGGIDSTVVLCSFLNQNINIIVGYTESSIEEYPWLFNFCKEKNIPLRYITNDSFKQLQMDYCFVTGIIGDQIVGTLKHFNSDTDLRIRSNQLDDYRKIVNPYLLELFDESIKSFPIEIIDYADFLWWVNFVFKYQWIQTHLMNITDFDPSLEYHHFFDTVEFQQWAMTNRDLNKQFILENKPLHYKLTFKEYIYNILNDAEYLQKEKRSSMSMTTFPFKFNENLFIEIDDIQKIISYEEYNEIQTSSKI